MVSALILLVHAATIGRLYVSMQNCASWRTVSYPALQTRFS
jgi:hypothetical protein